MASLDVTNLFIALILLHLGLRGWLVTRQVRTVAQHRDSLPADFQGVISLEAHQKAADYTMAKQRLALAHLGLSTALLVGWTLLGGLNALNQWVLDMVGREHPMVYQLVLVGCFALIGALLDLPLDYRTTFGLEQKFGFNRATPQLWWADQAKGLLVSLLLGGPLLLGILWIMGSTGGLWWLWAWGAWMGFSLLMMVVYPTWIAPLFNKFEPLADEALVHRVQSLMQRCGFEAQGLYVMDGSRRSAHANAYFTGLGRAKRVVFFDTLLKRLQGQELEAVLAHELGHFHHRHIAKRLLSMALVSLIALAALGWLSQQASFYFGLGVQPHLSLPNDALALILFMMITSVLGFFVNPLMATVSRQHEFEADAYASRFAPAAALRSALLKLIEDNANTLTPDPWFVRFFYSHPPAGQRLGALRQLERPAGAA